MCEACSKGMAVALDMMDGATGSLVKAANGRKEEILKKTGMDAEHWPVFEGQIAVAAAVDALLEAEHLGVPLETVKLFVQATMDRLYCSKAAPVAHVGEA